MDLLAIIERKKDLSVNLKYAEMTILTMYEELQIVRESEAKEDDLKKCVKVRSSYTRHDLQCRSNLNIKRFYVWRTILDGISRYLRYVEYTASSRINLLRENTHIPK